MRNLRRFEEFVNESKSDNIIDDILISLEDDIYNLLDKYKMSYKKQFEREMTDYDIELTRLIITYDMLRAIEIYTQPTDKLITINSLTSKKGNLEIFAQIQRGDEVYRFETEVIYAGGYNIQKLHYRYITKTNLPKTGNQIKSTEYSNKIKKLSNLEKLNLEIQRYEDRLKTAQETLQKNILKTDSQIWSEIKAEKDYYKRPTWSEIIKRGADKNFDYSEEKFNQEMDKYDAFKYDSWKNMNIRSHELSIKSYQKDLIRLRKKLEQLI